MPLNTSDIHKTICMEMRMAKAMNILNLCHGGTTKSSSFVTPPEHIGPNKFTFPSIDAAVVRSIPSANPREMKNSSLNNKHSVSAVAVTSNSGNKDNFCHNSNYTVHNSTNADLASVDSSDTFMSCQTHPFLSQGDLATVDDDNNLCDLDLMDADASFYINSAKNAAMLMRGSSLHSGPVNIIVDSSLSAPQVKKSTSGDTALRSLITSPIEEQYQSFVDERGSRVSLNETPVPKHRKTRFQQQQMATTIRPGDECYSMSAVETTVNNNGGSLSSSKKNRKASFMPSKIITNATKQLINQHLFGLQSMGSSKGNALSFSSYMLMMMNGSQLTFFLSLLMNSLDGSSDTHKRSKSILKNKSDARLASDPESERLLSDTGSGVSDISVIPVSLIN